MARNRESYETAGVVENGKLRMQDRHSFEAAIGEFPDGFVRVRFDSASAADIRTGQANRFQWRIFSIIAEASGHTKEEIHDWMCAKFLSYELVDEATGECTTLVRGTSKLKPKEHSEFMERVMAWAGEFFGCEFPEREAA